MASIFRKVANLRSDVKKSPRRFRPNSESDCLDAPGELSLDDDRDEFAAANSQAGTLSFHEDNNQDELQQKDYRRSYTVAFEGGQVGTVDRITFEVTSAEKIQDNKSSFVLYTILITRNQSGDRIPAMISKRYSDFDKLNKQLRKAYPSLLEQVAFPKKKISGNFTSETIAQRSRAFEQFLAHTFSIPEIRESQDLADFFYQDDITSAFSCLQNQKISDAIVILEKILPVQEKLLGDSHPGVVRTVCALVVCYSIMKNSKKAQRYSEAALSCLRGGSGISSLSVDSGISCGYGGSNSPYLLPLIQTSIRLCWETGKDKQDLEAMLTELRRSGVDTEDCPSLEDIFRKELKF